MGWAVAGVGVTATAGTTALRWQRREQARALAACERILAEIAAEIRNAIQVRQVWGRRLAAARRPRPVATGSDRTCVRAGVPPRACPARPARFSLLSSNAFLPPQHQGPPIHNPPPDPQHTHP